MFSIKIYTINYSLPIYAQALLNLGLSLEDLQSLLGHQDITTTQRRYAPFARPDLLDKGSKIDNFIN